MSEIVLRNGGIALVDEEDYKMVSKIKWRSEKRERHSYAISSRTGKNPLRMHELIIGKKGGLCIDHINGNGLDNRKSNLRFCTMSQNMANMPKPRTRSSSKFKGVCWSKRDERWRASIRINYKKFYIGNFLNEVDAANAYNERAKIEFGEFACLNQT